MYRPVFNGTVALHQGDLDTARTLHERALAIREAHLGKDHPTTAWSLNNLANVLRDQSDLDTARTLHERALAIREARLGADHPTTRHQSPQPRRHPARPGRPRCRPPPVRARPDHSRGSPGHGPSRHRAEPGVVYSGGDKVGESLVAG